MRDRIAGDVLEVRSRDYTDRFGSAGLRSHVVDIDPSNQAATVVGDLCQSATLPPDAYDCVILTQTLQFLQTPDAAIGNLWRSLRAGGTLLITVPCAARVDHELADSDLWRWTPVGLRRFVERYCDGPVVHVEAGGNLVATLASTLGLAVEDLRDEDLAEDDPVFPIVACVALTKPTSPPS